MCGMFHFLVYTLGKVVSRVSESFPSKGKKKKVARGRAPNTKGEVSPRGRKGGIEEGLGIGM